MVRLPLSQQVDFLVVDLDARWLEKNVSIPVHLLWILILHKTLSGLCFQMKGSGLVTLKECRTFLCSGHMMHPHVLLIVLTEVSRPSQMKMLRTLHVVWRLFIMVIENQL